jgi:maltooligosyltrehalose trehalohydrolase
MTHPLGALPLPTAPGVSFRVWAPKRSRVQVHFDGLPPLDLAREPGPDGYFSGISPDARPGTLYRYLLDGEGPFPDPVSRHQPQGVHGPSAVVDPAAFTWTDSAWKGLSLHGQVYYELHIGTFTAEGTYRAAISELPRLRDLGITCIELMPVNAFAGRHGWGYDGVALYAPHHPYGTPDDLRAFVDAAHAFGLGVILDVVYNHLGPDGSYHRAFSDSYYHSSREATEWGETLNFDGPGSGPTRDYFLQNAAYWIDEFHFDGLRLDATQAIHDDSPRHFLADLSDLTRAVAAKAGRSILLVGEDEGQRTSRFLPTDSGGHGLDALWNDDFHHVALVAATGRAEAYYTDYQGSPQELISASRRGFLFQGQRSPWQKKARGQSTRGLPAPRFITFLENHDQVANSARARRLRSLTSPGRLRALTAYWLLSPGSPLFFQGQEYGSTRPFHYFSDHNAELAPLVLKGRHKELSRFESIGADPDMLRALSDPGSAETFLSSRLDPAERLANAEIERMHRDLLALRRDDPVLRLQDSSILDGAVLAPEAFLLRYFGPDSDDRLLLVNLGRDLSPVPSTEPLLAPPAGTDWAPLWHSEHPSYGGSGAHPLDLNGSLRLPGHFALLLRPVPLP